MSRRRVGAVSADESCRGVRRLTTGVGGLWRRANPPLRPALLSHSPLRPALLPHSPLRNPRVDQGVSSRGSVVVESAIATPLVVGILLVVLLLALAWRDQLAATEAVGSGARVAALHPSSVGGWLPQGSAPPTGTVAVLDAVTDALASVGVRSVVRVVVFAAEGPATLPALARMPSGCRYPAGRPWPTRCVVATPGPTPSGRPWRIPGGDCGPGSCRWRDDPLTGGRYAEVGVYLAARRPPLVPGMGPGRLIEVAAVTRTEGANDVR